MVGEDLSKIPEPSEIVSSVIPNRAVSVLNNFTAFGKKNKLNIVTMAQCVETKICGNNQTNDI